MNNPKKSSNHELWSNDRVEMECKEYVAREKPKARERVVWCSIITAALMVVAVVAVVVTKAILPMNELLALIVALFFVVVFLASISAWNQAMNRLSALSPEVAGEDLGTGALSEAHMDEITEMAKNNPAVKAKIEEWMKTNPSPIFRYRDLIYLNNIAPPSNELLQKNKLPDLVAAIQAK